MKILLIDDEESSLQVLRILLEKYYPEMSVVAVAQDITEGEHLMKQHQPDILFLDIQMPNGTGFELLHNLGESTTSIVFVTAYDHYAIKAFKISAVDYLLKPIALPDLQNALQKCIKMREFHLKNPIFYYDLLKNTAAQPQDKLLVLNKYTNEKILYRKIICIEANSNYSIIYTNEHQKITLSKTLKEMEELVCDETHYFLRIHKSFIINTQHIKYIHKREAPYVVLQNDQVVEIPQRRKLELLGVLQSLVH